MLLSLKNSRRYADFASTLFSSSFLFPPRICSTFLPPIFYFFVPTLRIWNEASYRKIGAESVLSFRFFSKPRFLIFSLCIVPGKYIWFFLYFFFFLSLLLLLERSLCQAFFAVLERVRLIYNESWSVIEIKRYPSKSVIEMKKYTSTRVETIRCHAYTVPFIIILSTRP